MNSFTAIDFETAQGYRWSICQVGIVRIEQGIITDEVNLLVKPPNNYYWERFTDIHGITPDDTLYAPNFSEIWSQIEPFIKNQSVVAHNGFSFDFSVLQKTLEYYGLEVPMYEKYCTYKIFKNNLASLCQQYAIPLNHHDALSDARACAKLFELYLEKANKS